MNEVSWYKFNLLKTKKAPHKGKPVYLNFFFIKKALRNLNTHHTTTDCCICFGIQNILSDVVHFYND